MHYEYNSWDLRFVTKISAPAAIVAATVFCDDVDFCDAIVGETSTHVINISMGYFVNDELNMALVLSRLRHAQRCLREYKEKNPIIDIGVDNLFEIKSINLPRMRQLAAALYAQDRFEEAIIAQGRHWSELNGTDVSYLRQLDLMSKYADGEIEYMTEGFMKISLQDAKTLWHQYRLWVKFSSKRVVSEDVESYSVKVVKPAVSNQTRRKAEARKAAAMRREIPTHTQEAKSSSKSDRKNRGKWGA